MNTLEVNDCKMGLLPDKQICRLRMRWEGRERFPRHQIQRKPVFSDPGMHHGTCVTHVPWCMSGSLTGGSGENVPSIPGACATRNFTYLVRGPWRQLTVAWNSLYPTAWVPWTENYPSLAACLEINSNDGIPGGVCAGCITWYCIQVLVFLV